MAAQTLTAVQRCMQCGVIPGFIIPLTHVDAATLQTLQLELGHMVRVERRKSSFAHTTLEQDLIQSYFL